MWLNTASQEIEAARHIMNAKVMILAFLVMANGFEAAAQGIIGFVDVSFDAGSNLFSNPLLLEGTNTLSTIFTNNEVVSPDSGIPQGTTVALWNPTNQSFYSTSLFTNGSWTIDLPLPPGTGVLVVAPSAFSLGCVGTLLNPDGSDYTGDNLPLPPVFSGKNGTYLLGDKFAGGDVGTNIFLDICGRLPYLGEQVKTLTSTSTYIGSGNWDVVPTLDAGEAAFLNIMAPQPILNIVDINHQAVVSWPASLSGFVLQTNTTLNGGTWGNYAGTVVNNSVTNPAASGNLFFRLILP